MTSTLKQLETEARALDCDALIAREEEPGSSPLSFDTIYDRHFHDVLRWIRALGGREPDMEDLAQEVFLIVGRKLDTFDGTNLKGWLYRIAQRTVRDYRRAAWFRNMFGAKHAVDAEPTLLRLVEPSRGPSGHVEQREAQRAFEMILERMSAKHRSAFLLFEIEGYSGEEIAELEGVPKNTIWTRLHHARKEFAAIIGQLRKEGRLG